MDLKYVFLRHEIPPHGEAGKIIDGLNVFLSKDGQPYIRQRDVVEYNETEGWLRRFVRDEQLRYTFSEDHESLRTEKVFGKVKASFRDWYEDEIR